MLLTRLGAVLTLVPILLTVVSGQAVVGWAVAGLWLLAVLVDVALAPSPKRIVAERGGEDRVRLGDRTQTTLTLSNFGSRTARLRVRDAWLPSAGASQNVFTVTIPGRQRRSHTTTVHPTRRGDRHAGPVVVRHLGPLRLAGRERKLDAPWTVRALPSFEARKHLPSRIKQLRELDGRSRVLHRGEGTEFDSLREYVPGDDVRAIDWRGTARSTTVVVKTWRPERDRHVLVVLDSGRTGAARVGDQPRLDHAMDAALLLTALASRAGDRVDLLIGDRDVRASELRHPASVVLNRFVEAMAPVDAVLAEADHRMLVSEIMARVSPRSLVVFFTALDPAVIEEGLLPVVGPLLRRHRVVIASVTDPRVVELRKGDEDSSQAYAAAAAEYDLARSRDTSVLLQRAGITVVSADPEEFAPAVADHYLALKRQGLL